MGVLRLNGKAYGGGIDVIEVTQAQYNALPESKLSDDILYVISDSVNGSDGYPPLIYSDEEREIGVWRDGKPLYQKTVGFGNLSSGAQTVTVGLNNTETIIKLDIVVQVPSGAWLTLPITYTNTSNIPLYGATSDGYNASTDKVTINIGSERSFVKGYITIQYTKTTDTAGSGKWTTQGGLACHYSFTEHIIGTWFGETLWEKTIQYVSSGGTADTDKVIDTSIKHGTNCYVVDLQGVQTYGYLRDNSTCPKPNATSDPEPLSQSTLHLPYYGGATMASGQIYLYSDGIHFMKKGGTNNANSIILTVRYVKI